jgi:hypothetical protein
LQRNRSSAETDLESTKQRVDQLSAESAKMAEELRAERLNSDNALANAKAAHSEEMRALEGRAVQALAEVKAAAAAEIAKTRETAAAEINALKARLATSEMNERALDQHKAALEQKFNRQIQSESATQQENRRLTDRLADFEQKFFATDSKREELLTKYNQVHS